MEELTFSTLKDTALIWVIWGFSFVFSHLCFFFFFLSLLGDNRPAPEEGEDVFVLFRLGVKIFCLLFYPLVRMILFREETDIFGEPVGIDPIGSFFGYYPFLLLLSLLSSFLIYLAIVYVIPENLGKLEQMLSTLQ